MALSLPLCAQTPLRLVWADEFNGPANTPPDAAHWTADLGGNGWGNKELETYTGSLENLHVDGKGNLVIRAIHAGDSYTSGRIKTQNKFSFMYGKVEARMRIPAGNGIWPAFWMLGSDFDSGWPGCGEIDIMENVGKQPFIVYGTLHGPGYAGGSGIQGSYTLPDGHRFADDFHTYAIEWEPDLIRWYVDSRLYHTASRANLPPNAKWIGNHPFFLLLNLAVGGYWPGNPDSTTQFPQELVVDYVRVYSRVN